MYYFAPLNDSYECILLNKGDLSVNLDSMYLWKCIMEQGKEIPGNSCKKFRLLSSKQSQNSKFKTAVSLLSRSGGPPKVITKAILVKVCDMMGSYW